MPRLHKYIGALLLLAPLWASAQVSDPVQYAVAPSTPGPHQQVVIEANGVGGLLGDATITWRKDGAVAARGVGLSRYTFTTGALGTRTTVDVTIESAQGTFSRSFSFNPSAVNLVWEADTTVPSFYRGKPLYSAGSPLRVLALPVVYSGSARVAASALSYRWSRGDEPLQDLSGLGRSSVSFVGDQLQKEEDVAVDIYYGNTLVAHGETAVPATDPALVLYERDPLRGLLLDTAFPGQIQLTGKEITIQAAPYYFSAPDLKARSLSYAWALNGSDASGPDSASGIMTLRQTGAGAGGAVVEVSLQNNNQDAFVQQASAAVQLLFGSQTSLFGNLFQ